jgi:serine/threonine protein phosphatase 1
MGAFSDRKFTRIFAIGDIHGCAIELEALLRKIDPMKDDLVVFLGDYIDRGIDSRRVIDIILDLAKRCEVVALKGNHEAMFLDFLEHPESVGAGLFVLNGGFSTLVNYTAPNGAIEIPESHVSFYRDLQLSYETERFFFVHAGIPDQPLSTINAEKHEQNMLWSRFTIFKNQ